MYICKISIFQNFFQSETCFELADIKCFRDHLVKLRLGLFRSKIADDCDYFGELED